MRIAISNIAWSVAEDDAVGAYLAGAGVDAVELAPTKYWPAPEVPTTSAVADVRRRWEDRGQRVVALQSLLFGVGGANIFGEERARSLAADGLRRMIRIAHGLGASVLVFGSPRNRDRRSLSFAEAISAAAEFFRPLAREARDSGCVLGFEANPVAYQCNFCNTIEEALQLVREVDDPGFGAHVDLGILHMNGERAGEAIAAARPRLAHVHVSEPQLAAIGAGDVDHDAMAQALRDAGWAGYVSIEMRGGAAGEASLPLVQAAVRVAQRAYLNREGNP